MTMDFTPSPHASFSAALEAQVDAAMAQARNGERADYFARNEAARRPAIGAGSLGGECLRQMGYEFHRVPSDPGRAIGGKLHRVFDRGHDAEARMATYLRIAGFNLLTVRPDGKQYRFDIAQYEDGKGRIKGMIDGVFIDGPEAIDGHRLAYPCLWENKELNSKNWTKLSKAGLRKYGGDYFIQVQLNMGYVGLNEHSALFTAKNADSQEIYAELVPFDAAAAQAASDRGVRVISAASPEELPRVAAQADDFRCKWCNWRERCWATSVAAPQAPMWFGQQR